MSTMLPILKAHRNRLMKCRRCPNMQSTPVSGLAIESKIILVGQAPGVREPVLGKPFAWTAGKKLFRWFASLGIEEEDARQLIYFAAVCRCFPGKAPSGGDRAPDPQEIKNCSGWLDSEIRIIEPDLIIPVGRLAIAELMPCPKLDAVIGKIHRSDRAPGADIIPLPHPSGASTWVHREPGKALLAKALKLIGKHPAFLSAKQASARPARSEVRRKS